MSKKIIKETVSDETKKTKKKVKASNKKDGLDANSKAFIDRMAEKMADLINEAKGTGETTPQDVVTVKSKLFADGNLKEIEYPSDVSALTKDEKIVFFFKSLLFHQKDPESNRVFKALVEGTAADGGYLVPEDLRAEVWRTLPDYSVMRKIGRVIPTTSNSLKLNSLAARPAAYWTSEYASKTTSSAEFGQVELTPNDLVCLLPVTEQLIADANIDIVRFIIQLFAEEIARTEDKGFFTGSGTGQPRGIDTETLTTVNAGGTGDFDDILSLIYSVPQSHRTRAGGAMPAFVTNANTLMNLRKVKDSNNRYIWSPGSPDNGDPERIYGYPVYEQNDIGNGKVFFGNWRFYIIADRQQMRVATTTEGGDAWRRNAMEIKAVSRVDGRAVMTAPFAEINSF